MTTALEKQVRARIGNIAFGLGLALVVAMLWSVSPQLLCLVLGAALMAIGWRIYPRE